MLRIMLDYLGKNENAFKRQLCSSCAIFLFHNTIIVWLFLFTVLSMFEISILKLCNCVCSLCPSMPKRTKVAPIVALQYDIWSWICSRYVFSNYALCYAPYGLEYARDVQFSIFKLCFYPSLFSQVCRNVYQHKSAG